MERQDRHTERNLPWKIIEEKHRKILRLVIFLKSHQNGFISYIFHLCFKIKGIYIFLDKLYCNVMTSQPNINDIRGKWSTTWQQAYKNAPFKMPGSDFDTFRKAKTYGGGRFPAFSHFCLSWAGMMEQIAILIFPRYIIQSRDRQAESCGSD